MEKCVFKISPSIVEKPSALSDYEFEEIKKHTTIGWDILKSINDMPWLSKGARWHHERFDGNGYPDGLSGTEIPEVARILCIADSYDAMTSRRSYSEPKTQEEVKEEIKKCSGSQFDPEIAKIMLDIIADDKGFELREDSEF